MFKVMNIHYGSQFFGLNNEGLASCDSSNQCQQNRFIYLKPNSTPLPMDYKPKILVNPHFRKNVYINPQFTRKIHVNPKVLQNLPTTSTSVTASQFIQPQSTEFSKSTIITTRTKFVRVPKNNQTFNSTRKVFSNSLKAKPNSLLTKYKIIKSFARRDKTKTALNYIKGINKFKLDKRTNIKVDRPTAINTTPRKKYVYINRFLTLSTLAKNTMLKQNMKKSKFGYVNINGIFYKKSPNSLKRQTSKKEPIKNKKNVKSFEFNVCKNLKSSFNMPQKREDSRRTVIKHYKIISSNKKTVTYNKLKKCNIPCSIYKRSGKCEAKEKGKCFKLHNPNQIDLCMRFLQGACHNNECLLSHKVSPEKMPTCKFYLEGLCFKDDCPYLHVKISPKSDICNDFLQGFCKEGAQCSKRHQLLCPAFEKHGSCSKKRCPYPHGTNSVRKYSTFSVVAKKFSTLNPKNQFKQQQTNTDQTKSNSVKSVNSKINDFDIIVDISERNNRYFDELNDINSDVKSVTVKRPKLGELPSFIPLFEEL